MESSSQPAGRELCEAFGIKQQSAQIIQSAVIVSLSNYFDKLSTFFQNFIKF